MFTGLLQAQTTNEKGVVRLDPSFDLVVAMDSKLEILFDGGSKTSLEGPTWIHSEKPGYLLFSDVTGNVINKWTPADRKVSEFLDHIYTGTPEEAHRAGDRLMIGPNGATLDRRG